MNNNINGIEISIEIFVYIKKLFLFVKHRLIVVNFYFSLF